jgi:hypothetical protein
LIRGGYRFADKNMRQIGRTDVGCGVLRRRS